MRRKYSDKEKARALAALDLNGGNVSGTSKQLKIPRSTLLLWSRDVAVSSDMPELRQEKKQELSALFENVARAYLGRAITTDAVAETKGKDAVIAAATATDKLQLLLGKPTEILSLHDKAKELAELIGPEFGDIPVEDNTHQTS